jgi:hypothetical protein
MASGVGKLSVIAIAWRMRAVGAAITTPIGITTALTKGITGAESKDTNPND